MDQTYGWYIKEMLYNSWVEGCIKCCWWSTFMIWDLAVGMTGQVYLLGKVAAGRFAYLQYFWFGGSFLLGYPLSLNWFQAIKYMQVCNVLCNNYQVQVFDVLTLWSQADDNMLLYIRLWILQTWGEWCKIPPLYQHWYWMEHQLF